MQENLGWLVGQNYCYRACAVRFDHRARVIISIQYLFTNQVVFFTIQIVIFTIQIVIFTIQIVIFTYGQRANNV